MACGSSESVILGHYIKQGEDVWLPALAQSTPLFNAVVSDAVAQVEEILAKEGVGPDAWRSVLLWSGGQPAGEQHDISSDQQSSQQTPQVQVKHRTLAMIATFHNSLRVLSLLLHKGADPHLKTPGEGLCCYDFIKTSAAADAATLRAMLDDASDGPPAPGTAPAAAPVQHTPTTATAQDHAPSGDADGSSRAASTVSRSSSRMALEVSQDLAAASPARSPAVAQGAGAGFTGEDAPTGYLDPDENLGYSTKELTRPEYSTANFRMYCFKVLPCSKRYAHDWRACPFAHPTENARRRDPREVVYSSVACPDYKQGFCIRGDTCQYAHGVFESWLHPSRYRTQLCKDGERCNRPVCFFAHTLVELRAPSHAFHPGPAERLRVPQELLTAAAGGPALAAAASPQLSPAAVLGEQVPVLSPDARLLRDQNVQQVPGVQGSPGAYPLQPHVVGLAAPTPLTVAPAPAGAPEAGLPSPVQPHLVGAYSPSGASSSSGGRGGGRAGSSPSLAAAGAVAPLPMPRMSNAFARRHGIDPKSNPLLNLQALALQQEVHQAGKRGRARQNSRRQQQRAAPPHSPGPQYPPRQQPLPQQHLPSPGQPSSAGGRSVHNLGGQRAPHVLLPDAQAQLQQHQLQEQYLLQLHQHQHQQHLAAMQEQHQALMSPQGHLMSPAYGSPALMHMQVQDPNALALLLGGMSVGSAAAPPMQPMQPEALPGGGVAAMLPGQQLPLQGLPAVPHDMLSMGRSGPAPC